MNKIQQLKAEQKEKAIEIKKLNKSIKEYQREHGGSHGTYPYVNWNRLQSLQRDYRYCHIAYCMLRGKTLDQIEKTHKTGNEPDMSLVKKIMDKYYEAPLLEQAI